jgi:hypothetical protein
MTLLLDTSGRGAVAGQVRRRGDAACREGGSATTARGPAAGSPRTLDELVSSAWDGLRTGTSATCPVCHGELAPRWSAGAGVVGGRCGDCGSELG